MEADKSATIREAEWMEKEIPRIKGELEALKQLEHELLTSPLETVSKAYTDTYRTAQERFRPLYRRRRKVVQTRRGLRERTAEEGWLSIAAAVLMVVTIGLAAHVAYRGADAGNPQRGLIWGSVLLFLGIAFSLAPMATAFFYERYARQDAERAASAARQSAAFLEEKHGRQEQLRQCRQRRAELEERLKDARTRYDQLRELLISGNHRSA